MHIFIEMRVCFFYYVNEVIKMKRITVTEFRRRLGYYLELANKELLVITKYGKDLVLVIGANQKPSDISMERISA